MHGITSLTAWQANPADILAGNRGHWGVENREHYVRDRTFDEDRSQVRTGASPQFLATARNIVMSLLRLAGCENVARGMEYLSRRLDQILALLGVLPEPIRKGDAYTTTLPMTLSLIQTIPVSAHRIQKWPPPWRLGASPLSVRPSLVARVPRSGMPSHGLPRRPATP